MSINNDIFIKGAKVNNLKNVDVTIPRNKLIVITGLSGSGKSSLAFDTLYAEGQRRYVESLSSYARQFLSRMGKPECEYIKGIPPAIAIEQKTNTRNSRSTVGTSTEIYEYLRLLFARIGKTISPISGEEVKKHQTSDIVKDILAYPDKTKFAVFAPVTVGPDRTMKEQLEILLKEGYTRLYVDGKAYRTSEVIENETLLASKNIELMLDRLIVSDDKTLKSRLAESAETAFFEGHGECIIRIFLENETITKVYSKSFEADGITFEEPTDMMFNFNNPIGACPVCKGFGNILGVSEDLVVPDKSRSIYEGAVMCWRGEKMGEWLKEFIKDSQKYNFPIHTPYCDLTKEQKDLLWHGARDVWGIDRFFQFVEENLYKIQYRVMYSRYRGKVVCPNCHGSRLKKEALYVKVGGLNIGEVVTMPISEAKRFFDNLQLDETDAAVAKRLMAEIKSRLQFLLDVGLGYLTLDRLSSTLSGGESQRINLATSLGSSLVGSLYILDEPSIGLHSRDTHLLVNVLRKLQALGNTVVVVEHDEDIIKEADYIIDIGPNAGMRGGEVVYQGPASGIESATNSYTAKYLSGEEKIEVPEFRRPWNNFIEIKEAFKNNLKKVNVKFPLNVITVVTGVSGSGKSTLVNDIFYENMKRYLDGAREQAIDCHAMIGDMNMIKSIEFVDQNSIGKSTRSNPVTYVGAYDEIRKLYADQPLSKQMGFSAAYFSFNKEGGRCEECKGEGKITVSMQFMADIMLECESCHGKRFKQEVLDVEYHGVNIYQMLEMTVNQAIALFEQYPGSQEKKIIKKLKPLQDVGLGYIKLGQSSSSLSGGENQRVKLASYLGEEKQEPTLFVFDEPTTGLHFHDIKTLMKAFNALIERGHTVIIIEHNMDVIKCADHIIDLGPEGGNGGGNIVFEGTPEDLVNCEQSYTGKYLKEKLA